MPDQVTDQAERLAEVASTACDKWLSDGCDVRPRAQAIADALRPHLPAPTADVAEWAKGLIAFWVNSGFAALLDALPSYLATHPLIAPAAAEPCKSCERLRNERDDDMEELDKVADAVRAGVARAEKVVAERDKLAKDRDAARAKLTKFKNSIVQANTVLDAASVEGCTMVEMVEMLVKDRDGLRKAHDDARNEAVVAHRELDAACAENELLRKARDEAKGEAELSGEAHMEVRGICKAVGCEAAFVDDAVQMVVNKFHAALADAEKLRARWAELRDWAEKKRDLRLGWFDVNKILSEILSKMVALAADAGPAKEAAPPRDVLGELREANVNRAAKWHGDGKAGTAGIEFAAVELAGEVGELCNAVKKLMRFKYGMAGGVEGKTNLADELADVVICADLLGIKLDIDLASAVVKKFNATSEKHGFPDRLALRAEQGKTEPPRKQAESTCPRCEGSGRFQKFPDTPEKPCAVCNGTGSITTEQAAPPHRTNRERLADHEQRLGELEIRDKLTHSNFAAFGELTDTLVRQIAALEAKGTKP